MSDCNCVQCQDRRDAARYRWLRARMGWYSTADSPGGLALVVIWYHATDGVETTLDALIDAAHPDAPGKQPRTADGEVDVQKT
jgi:hypothetical protein